MGAATALLHADWDHSIAGIVVDSGFTSLKELAKELAKKYTKVPSFLLAAGIKVINSSVKSRAHFDL